jgi:cholest-4-en-3-one 26-monooxygenase
VSAPRIPDGFDFTDPDLYEERVPIEEFAELRRTAPVWWNAQPHGIAGFGDDGYWVVSRHAEVREVSRNSDAYSSEENTALIRFRPEMTREKIEMQRVIMLNIDPPKHSKVRGIVSRGFTPKAVNNLKAGLAERAQRIVDEAKARGSGDFVTEVACELPLQAIAELLGIPQDDRHKVFEWSNKMIGSDDPDYAGVDPELASVELLGYAWQMAEDRKKCPMDDIATKLLHADIDGDALTSDEFGFFMLMLAVAGNETTRNAISHGMNAFFDNPEQWERFIEERPATAADEIVRYSTPITSFQRTAKHDTVLGGAEIKKGQRVGLFYGSANFDSEVFDDPYRFDITRDPNPHVGFGGTGAHYCIGANLAKVEIDLIFNAIADNMPNITKSAEPRRLRSGWVNGIKELRVDYS